VNTCYIHWKFCGKRSRTGRETCVPQVSEVSRNLTKPARDLRWPRKVSRVMSVRPRMPGWDHPSRDFRDDVGFPSMRITKAAAVNKESFQAVDHRDWLPVSATRQGDFWAAQTKRSYSLGLTYANASFFCRIHCFMMSLRYQNYFHAETASIGVSNGNHGKCALRWHKGTIRAVALPGVSLWRTYCRSS